MSFEEFEAYLKRTKKTPSTRIVYLSNLELVERFLGKKLDKNITKKDIQRFLDSISDQASNTIIMKMMILRLYFKWLYGMKKGYPDIVDFEFPKKKSNNLTPDDLLTEEEVLKLIDACDSIRNKAMISLLFDSAIRRAELGNLDIKDVKINGETGTIEVDGKTGRRQVPISISIPYLRDWVNSHPFKDNLNSPLFIDLKDKVGKRLHPETIRYILKTAKKRVGINKRIYPHLFRHSRLTMLDKKNLSHTAMKYFAGWSKDSKMPSIYSHFSAQDTAEAVFRADGVVKKANNEIKILEPVKCFKCKSLQNPKNVYCSICNSPLNPKLRLAKIIEKVVYDFVNNKLPEKQQKEIWQEIEKENIL